jgi:predicted outer membrane protein
MKALILSSMFLLAMATQAAAQDRPATDPPVPEQDRPILPDQDQPGAVTDEVPGQVDQEQPNLRDRLRTRRIPATDIGANASGLQEYFAACWLIGNHEEITISQFALERAQNPKVKQFAQQMIEDHTRMVAQLRQFAPQYAEIDFTGGVTRFPEANTRGEERRENRRERRENREINRENRDNPPQERTGDEQPGVETPRPEIRIGTGADATEDNQEEAGVTAEGTRGSDDVLQQLLQFNQQAAGQCLMLTREALEKHSGADFDQAYLGAQVGAHIGMLAKLRAAEGYTNGEFRELVTQGLKTTEEHLQHAEQLLQELAGTSGGEAPLRRPEQPERPTNRPNN